MTMRMARERSVAIDDAVLAKVEEKTWKSGGTLDDVIQARNVSDPTPNDSLLLMAQEAAGVTDSGACPGARRPPIPTSVRTIARTAGGRRHHR